MNNSTKERAERIAELLDDDAIPVSADGNDEVFDAPWQPRLFELALAFHDSLEAYDCSAFQDELVDAIADVDPRAKQDHVERVYYEQ